MEKFPIIEFLEQQRIKLIKSKDIQICHFTTEKMGNTTWFAVYTGSSMSITEAHNFRKDCDSVSKLHRWHHNGLCMLKGCQILLNYYILAAQMTTN